MTTIYRVEKHLAYSARAEDGRRVGRVWQLVATKRNRAVAERIFRQSATDDPDTQHRLVERRV